MLTNYNSKLIKPAPRVQQSCEDHMTPKLIKPLLRVQQLCEERMTYNAGMSEWLKQVDYNDQNDIEDYKQFHSDIYGWPMAPEPETIKLILTVFAQSIFLDQEIFNASEEILSGYETKQMELAAYNDLCFRAIVRANMAESEYIELEQDAKPMRKLTHSRSGWQNRSNVLGQHVYKQLLECLLDGLPPINYIFFAEAFKYKKIPSSPGANSGHVMIEVSYSHSFAINKKFIKDYYEPLSKQLSRQRDCEQKALIQNDLKRAFYRYNIAEIVREEIYKNSTALLTDTIVFKAELTRFISTYEDMFIFHDSILTAFRLKSNYKLPLLSIQKPRHSQLQPVKQLNTILALPIEHKCKDAPNTEEEEETTTTPPKLVAPVKRSAIGESKEAYYNDVSVPLKDEILRKIATSPCRHEFKAHQIESLLQRLGIKLIHRTGSHFEMQLRGVSGGLSMPHGAYKSSTVPGYTIILLCAFLTRAGILQETEYTLRAVEKTKTTHSQGRVHQNLG